MGPRRVCLLASGAVHAESFAHVCFSCSLSGFFSFVCFMRLLISCVCSVKFGDSSAGVVRLTVDLTGKRCRRRG
jgi:hypothetical protein